MRLTQKAVDGLALDRDRVLWDDELPGLGLRVQAGRKTWVVRYRVAGAQRQKSLPGALPLRQARAHAAEIRALAARGADVVRDGRAAADAARRGAEGARARSLGLVAERYLADAAKRLRPSSLKPARLYLAKHWRALHERPADELGRREVMAILEPYAGRATAAQIPRSADQPPAPRERWRWTARPPVSEARGLRLGLSLGLFNRHARADAEAGTCHRETTPTG